MLVIPPGETRERAILPSLALQNPCMMPGRVHATVVLVATTSRRQSGRTDPVCCTLRLKADSLPFVNTPPYCNMGHFRAIENGLCSA